MPEISALNALEPIKIKSVTDTVFEELHQQILALELPPGTKISEIEVAKRLDVSRQPVRDAFFRLSELGFILIRPQRATLISKISETAVHRAKFVRIALEMACWLKAIELVSAGQITELEDLADRQKAALDANEVKLFHALDDAFHRRICEIAGHDYVWALIREQKAHIDRVRFLSLTIGAAQRAYDDHLRLLAALKERDKTLVADALTDHLERIELIIKQIRKDNPDYFEA